MMRNNIILVLITAFCFTTYEPVAKLFAGEINPFAITAIRFFVGSLFLLPFSFIEIKKNKIKLTLNDWLWMFGLGILFICISMVLLQFAIKVADSPALIAIIFSSNSIFTIILSAIFLKNKLTIPKIIGIILCVIGVLVSADLSKGTNLLSVLLALLSSLTFSIYTVLSKKNMSKLNGIVQTGFSFLGGSMVLIIITLISGINIFGGISTSNIGQLLYVAIIVTGVGYFAYSEAVRIGGAHIAAMAFLIKPILTPLATFVINGIKPDSNIFIALILVVVGASLATGMQKSIKRGKSICGSDAENTSANESSEL